MHRYRINHQNPFITYNRWLLYRYRETMLFPV
jgi:hypothetical protein